MIKLIEYTKDFEPFNSDKPYLGSEYKILIEHDNSKENISLKFKIKFLDKNKEEINSLKVNSWSIEEIYVEGYYGRAKVFISIQDPNGVSVPRFESGGSSLGIDEESNIDSIHNKINSLLLQVLEYSFFQNYRLKLDFDNLKKRVQDNFVII